MALSFLRLMRLAAGPPLRFLQTFLQSDRQPRVVRYGSGLVDRNADRSYSQISIAMVVGPGETVTGLRTRQNVYLQA